MRCGFAGVKWLAQAQAAGLRAASTRGSSNRASKDEA